MAGKLPLKRIIGIGVSVALIAVLVRHVDTQALLANFRRTRWDLFAAALALFVPQILVIAWRWKRLVAPFTPLPLAESVRLVLAGSSMNLLMPGKLGDLTKGWFLARQGHVSTSLGLGVVAFEKMLDVAALAAVMLGGTLYLFARTAGVGAPAAPLHLLVLPAGLGVAAVAAVALLYFAPLERMPGYGRLTRDSATGVPGRVARLLKSSHTTMATLQARGSRRGEILVLSGLIWLLHLVQIYLFFASVNAAPPAGEFITMVPLAIFIGLIPISLAGFGTRDAALVLLLPSLPASAVLAASFYVNLRYILPAVAGVPYLARYATSRKPPTKAPEQI